MVDRDFRWQKSDQDTAPRNLAVIIEILLLYMAVPEGGEIRRRSKEERQSGGGGVE